MRAISRSLWIRNIVRNGFLNFQPSTQNMQAILVRTNTTASMNATSFDSLSNDDYSAKLAMSHKGAMVVKNNLISFDLTKDFNDVDYLWITAYCLNGYKESRLILTKEEARSLYKTSERSLRQGSQGTFKVSFGDNNYIKINSTKTHIGDIYEFRHRKGLYQNNLPVKLPFADREKFLQLLSDCLQIDSS